MPGTRDLPTAVLRTFVTIVDRGGFTQAAQTLGLTQPTVSQQLKKLEEIVGQPLIARGQRRLALTSEGQTLLDFARRILQLNDEAIASLTRPSVEGTLRVGIPHEFSISILPRMVGAFSQIHPNVMIEVDCELSKNLLVKLDQYDLVIALHKPHDEAGLDIGKCIRREPLAWVSSADFEFDPTHQLQVIAAPPPCIYRETIQRALSQFKPGWATRLTSSSYGAVCATVSTGMGVTLLATSVIPDQLVPLESDALPDLPSLELRLHFDRTNAAPATRTFVEFVLQNLADQPS